jgi:hypothetical protein
MPGKSMNFKSTITALFALANSNTSFGPISYSFGILLF